jgi:hypothetical protein
VRFRSNGCSARWARPNPGSCKLCSGRSQAQGSRLASKAWERWVKWLPQTPRSIRSSAIRFRRQRVVLRQPGSDRRRSKTTSRNWMKTLELLTVECVLDAVQCGVRADSLVRPFTRLDSRLQDSVAERCEYVAPPFKAAFPSGAGGCTPRIAPAFSGCDRATSD